MKYFNLFLAILIIFSKTGNILCEENIFDVNNIKITKDLKSNNEKLANRAIKKGFENLKEKILTKPERDKLSNLEFADVKRLVSYYQIKIDEKSEQEENQVIFNVSFDREKVHRLFYKRRVLYSEIINKEIYILPILKKNNKNYIYNKNYFYENWNRNNESQLIEFILPLENIEIIQIINANKDNLLDISLSNFFKEYSNNNLALVLIEQENLKPEKIFLKTKIQGKNINKNINIMDQSFKSKKILNEKIIAQVKTDITNIIKNENLIDVRTPSFLNTKLFFSKNNDLYELNKRLNKIELIENVFVQEFNNEFTMLKIKYLGKLEKIIDKLNKEKIELKLIGEDWSLKII